MPSPNPHSRVRWLSFGVLGLLAGWALAAGARASDPPPQRATAGGSVRSGAPAAPAQEKRFTLEMHDAPWKKVFEWLADQTGLPVVGGNTPTGTFTFSPPKGAQPRTLAQIIDILNDALAHQRFLLLRGERSLTVVAADEKIDPGLIPRVRLQDLDQRGRTELVSLVLPLTSLVAEDAAREVKKLTGPFGDVVPLGRGNQLLVQDTAGNLARIVRTLAEVEAGEAGGSSDVYSYSCKYVKAEEAARILRQLLGTAQDGRGVLRAPGAGAGGGFGQPRPPLAGMAAVPAVPSFSIAVDDRTNVVLLRGRPELIGTAKVILNRIDVPDSEPAIAPGAGEFRAYALPADTARAVAQMLQEIYSKSSGVRVAAAGNNRILVYASPAVQAEVQKQLERLRTEDEQTPTPGRQPAGVRGSSSQGERPATASSIGDKLDQILERLDRIERQLNRRPNMVPGGRGGRGGQGGANRGGVVDSDPAPAR